VSTTYVHCKLLPGLFESEFYVLINGSSSAYVNKINVKTSGTPNHNVQVDGKVFAYVISERDDQSLIEVPGEAVVGGLRTWVPNALLAPA
jgi:hypothetical protein